MPAIKAARQIVATQTTRPIDRKRLLLVSAVCGLIGLMCFWIVGSPASSSAPAIVQLEGETILRAPCDGFVDAILVNDGQAVLAGQKLVVQRNDQLATDIEMLIQQKLESDIKTKVFLQARELASYQAEIEKSNSLARQLDEKQRQLNELTICSPFDGVVLRRNLDELTGAFIKQGSPIVTVARCDTPEIVVSIDQHDFASIQSEIHPEMKAVFPGLPPFGCQLTTKRPRATTVPAHPAMCADRGGPLAVRPIVRAKQTNDEPQQVELLSPHFHLELSIPDGYRSKLLSGQQGTVIFPVARHSIGTYWYLSLRDWVTHKIDVATKSSMF